MFHGGVHPSEHKDTSMMPIEDFYEVGSVLIPMFMHIGAPCKPLVKRGDVVARGQIIGEATGISAPIHASVSGTVKSVKDRLLATNSVISCVEIENDGEMRLDDSLKAPSYSDRESFLQCIRDSGVVGLGGAGFPTWQKFNESKPGVKIKTLLLNGMECEPYITSDHRQMLENADLLIKGSARLVKELDMDRAIIGLEDNKPDALKVLKAKLEELKSYDKVDSIEVRAFPTRYPQGAAKIFAYAATGIPVPAGSRTTDIGVQVINVSTVIELERYFETGLPLVDRVITLTGDCVNKPGNYRVPIGALLDELVESLGGFSQEPSVVTMGGPMNGQVLSDLNTPIIKNNNAILLLSDERVDIHAEHACIRCGRCIEVCPANLMPLKLDQAARNRDFEMLDAFAVNNCVDCGSCAYICPSKRHLLQSIKAGKAFYRSESRKMTAAKKEA
ncbi:MAG: electron transport complex subunit RsxC [Coriobacteriia bacterium]|nr:electron transport complex subunit RsxC [Coriobacteriia bacterium]